jgi:DNA polymerase elongation subunit (family B)
MVTSAEGYVSEDRINELVRRHSLYYPEEFYEDYVDRVLSRHPTTGELNCFVVMDLAKSQGSIVLVRSGIETFGCSIGGIPFVINPVENEEEALKAALLLVGDASKVVTFGGRSFDFPFLSVRGMMYGLTCKKNLDPYRYRYDYHVDLVEVFTHHRAMEAFTLEEYVAAFEVDTEEDNPNEPDYDFQVLEDGLEEGVGDVTSEEVMESATRAIQKALLFARVQETLSNVVPEFRD